MAKLATLTALLALITLFISQAYAHKIIVEIDEDTNQAQGCEEEVRKHDLCSCVEYITAQHHGEEWELRMVTGGENPHEHRVQCCHQIEQVEEQCQCQALKRIVNERTPQVQAHGEEAQKMTDRAMNLQAYCRLPCQFV